MYKKRLKECVDKYKKSLTVKSKKKLAVISTAAVSVTAGLIVGIIIALMRNTNIKTNHYSVTFVANTDTEHKGTIQKKSEKTFNDVTKLDAGYAPDPLDNYTFEYWENENKQKVEFPVTFSKNEKYYAKWSKAAVDTYTVKFETNKGSPVGDYSVLKGDSISRPESTKEHFALKAWHEGSDKGPEVFKKLQDTAGYEKYEPKGNVIIYAEWEQKEFNVGLDLDEGKAPEGVKEVEIDGKKYSGYPYVSKLDTAPIPTKDGFDFMGWFDNPEKTGEAVKFSYEVKKETVLYAKWEKSSESKQITINAGGGYLPKVGIEETDPQTRTITTGYIPYAPTAYYDATYKDKYELVGWFDAASGGNQISFPHKVEDGETIYAQWKQVRFAATIYYNSIEEGTTERTEHSWDNLALVRFADIPTPQEGDMKLGTSGSAADPKAYTLDHWDVYNLDEKKFVHPEHATAGDLDITPLTYNAKINASWKHTKFTVTLHSATTGGTTEVLKYQTTETLGSKGPSVPDKWVEDHSEFTGWTDISGNPIDFATYKLTGDADFYMSQEVAMGKVYLHTAYAKGSTTYNGTDDWYYTDKYKELGAGFAARDLPDKEHYKKLGWTYTTDDSEPSSSSIIYSKECTEHVEGTKIYPWPAGGVRPTANGIAHLYPTYEQSQFEIKFDVGEKATACNSIWTLDKNDDGDAVIGNDTAIPESSKAFSKFKGWKLEGGSVLTEEQLRKTKFKADTTLHAVFETSAWTVNFYVIDDGGTHQNYTIGLKQEGLTQLSAGSLSDVISSFESGTVHKRTGAKLAGFVTEANKPTDNAGTYDLTNIISSLTVTADTNLYAVYYKTSFTVKINLNGAKIGTSTDPVELAASNEPISDKSIWYSQLAAKGTITAPSDLPTFYGFAKHGTSTIIDFPYTVTENIELDMIWVNNSKYMVTFDAGNGDFYYTQSGITRTTPVISYEVDKNDTSIWTSTYTPTLAHVYEQARKSRGCLSEDYLVNDGFTFKAWRYNGIDIGDDYEITASKGFEARWERADVDNWWDDSTGLIISYAEDMSDPSSTEHPSAKTVLEDKYWDAFNGTKATKDGATDTKESGTFVGLEKEVKIPTLSTEYTFTTRVIGEKQDTSSDGTKKTYLTIQFVDAPISGCYASDSNKDPRYENSVIKNSSIPYLLSSMPGSLTNHFQSVKKPYLSGTSTTSTGCKTMKCSNESLFILSAYELGGKNTSGGSAYNESSNKGTYSDYIFQYKYYENLGDGSSSSQIIERAFTYPYTNTTTYINVWTRTPKGAYTPKSETNEDVYFIGCNDTNINLGAFCCWDPMSGYGICPAFCIGLYTRSS